MGSGACLSGDCPEQYWDVIEIVRAEEITLIDAVATGKIDHSDFDAFLNYAAATDYELDPGLIHLIEIVNTLLEEQDS